MNFDTSYEKIDFHNMQIDPLTNLPNQTFLISKLKTHQSTSLALLFIEFDDLARFNDTFGFDIDDQLIIQLSKNISSLLQKDDILARVGNYQFAILVKHIQNKEQIEILAKHIMNMLYEPFSVEENMFYVSASIGISISSKEETTNPYRLFKTAENTMRRIQKDGKNYIAFTQHNKQPDLQKSVHLMKDLPIAIDNGDIYFVYQGQYSHKKQKFSGAELLARWEHPVYGNISPEIFIPLAEQSGMIGPLTTKILIEASKMFTTFKELGIHDISISVNISPIVLMESDFIDTVNFIRKSYNLIGKKLNFEIMEETMAQNINNLIQVLEKIRALDIKIEIDDYGTGHTSLRYLENLPIDTIKIDKSFVQDIDKNTKRMALFKAIVDMSKALDIDVIAEGVETQSEDEIIKTFKNITVQGYLYSKPLKSNDFIRKLQAV